MPEGIVSRTVYFECSSNAKYDPVSIEVLNCGDYYVYHLPDTPDCYEGFCGIEWNLQIRVTLVLVQFLKIKMISKWTVIAISRRWLSWFLSCVKIFVRALWKYLWEPSGNLKQANRQSQVFRHGDSYCLLLLLLPASHLCNKKELLSFPNDQIRPSKCQQWRTLHLKTLNVMGDLRALWNSSLWVWAEKVIHIFSCFWWPVGSFGDKRIHLKYSG